jgi:hypothetical protein
VALPLQQDMKLSCMQENNNQQTTGDKDQPFETDTQKLVNKHMADPNHVITEEEMAKLQVGQTPPEARKAQQNQQDMPEADERAADSKSIKDDDALPGAQKVTPWDVTT